MRIIILNVILTYLICITNGQQNYELEFLEEGIYKPCEQYPDNYIDRLFDLSNLNFEEVEDGNMHIKGYVILKTSIKPPQPSFVDVFKKERGTWQPTLISQKRHDFCTSAYDKSEHWHSIFKNTPKDQQKCPFTEGHRIDFDITEPAIFSLPMRNAEGEYNIHVEMGNKNSDNFICCEIFVMAHKVRNK